MDINTNVANEIEALLSQVKQISEQAIKATWNLYDARKAEANKALTDYKKDVADKQVSVDDRNTEISARLAEIETERDKFAGQIASAISNGDGASVSSLEAEVDSLNTEEYTLKQKATLYKSFNIHGDDALFERVIIKYRNYLEAEKIAETERNKIHRVFIAWRDELNQLQRATGERDRASYFLDNQVASLLLEHEPVDMPKNRAGNHDDACRRYLHARIKGVYDRGFDGTTAGDKLRELEGKPLFPGEQETPS